MKRIIGFSVRWSRFSFRKAALLTSFLLSVIINCDCLASSGVVPAGNYKILFTCFIVDKKSEKLKSLHGQAYIDLQYRLIELNGYKQSLQNRIKKRPKGATKNQQRLLASLDREISALETASSEQKAYQDKETINFSIEYGLSDDANLGVQIGYKQESLASPFRRYSPVISRAADIYLKYKLLGQDQFIISLQPKIYLDKYDDRMEHWFGEIGLMLGYFFNKNLFCDMGIFAANCFTNHCDNKSIFSFSVTEGLKLGNGLVLYNFSKYYFRKTDNRIYRHSVYEQILLAKEVSFGDLNRNYLTLAAGYFFDRSLTDLTFKLSGPIFSLWFEL